MINAIKNKQVLVGLEHKTIVLSEVMISARPALFTTGETLYVQKTMVVVSDCVQSTEILG